MHMYKKYICVCEDIHMCTYLCMCVYIYTTTLHAMSVYTQLHMCTTYVCVYIYIHNYIACYICICTTTYVYYLCMCVHTYVCVYKAIWVQKFRSHVGSKYMCMYGCMLIYIYMMYTSMATVLVQLVALVQSM